MEQLLHFLLTYQNYVFLAMFGLLAFVAFVNFVHNPYAKQNAQLKRFNKRTLQKPSCIVLQVKHLPAEYQRQWRAFVNSGCSKPSTVFEFVKLRKRYLLWFVHFVATTTSIAYIVIGILLNDAQIFTTQVAFLLFSILVMLLNKLIGEINIAFARRVFGKFLHDLNAVTHILKEEKHPTEQPTAQFGSVGSFTQQTSADQHLQGAVPKQQSAIPTTTQTVISTPTQPHCEPTSMDSQNRTPTAKSTVVLQDVVGHSPTTEPLSHPLNTQSPIDDNGDIIEKAVQILKQKGLDNPRTAEEQRKLNIALNNLLQACCKHKAQN